MFSEACQEPDEPLPETSGSGSSCELLVQDENGSRLEYQYHKALPVLAIRDGKDSTSFTYDDQARLIEAKTGDSRAEFTYQSSRFPSEAKVYNPGEPAGKILFKDSLGFLVRMELYEVITDTLPSQTVILAYAGDSLNRLSLDITDAQTGNTFPYSSGY